MTNKIILNSIKFTGKNIEVHRVTDTHMPRIPQEGVQLYEGPPQGIKPSLKRSIEDTYGLGPLDNSLQDCIEKLDNPNYILIMIR